MKHSTITISTRLCTEVEAYALMMWSVSALPYCLTWLARRGLQPPHHLVVMLQQLRFDAIPITATLVEPLITVPAEYEHSMTTRRLDESLEALATHLTHALQQLQAFVPQSDANGRDESCHHTKEAFVTEARDLRRFYRAWVDRRLQQIELVAGESMLIPLFSLQRSTLYLPGWLIDALPRTMFEPGASFYRARPASLAWLVLDAIVVTHNDEFKTI